MWIVRQSALGKGAKPPLLPRFRKPWCVGMHIFQLYGGLIFAQKKFWYRSLLQVDDGCHLEAAGKPASRHENGKRTNLAGK